MYSHFECRTARRLRCSEGDWFRWMDDMAGKLYNGSVVMIEWR